ncbi:MAG: branched-chain amino acid ABC transporter permease, partial [Chloroflexota bacterium]
MIWLQVLVSGLSLSGYYALLAVGFALIFATFRIFHISHAVVFGVAGYTFFVIYRLWSIHFLIAAALAIMIAAITGWLIDTCLYRPILRRGGSLFSVFIASLGLSLIFEAVVLILTKGALSKANASNMEIIEFDQVAIRLYDVAVIAIVAVLYTVVYAWVMRTRIGLEIRALSDNPNLATVVGVDITRTRNAVFLAASALAGVAGIITAYDAGMTPTKGIELLFITLVAVIFGGTRNIFLGALAGGLVMGLVTATAGFL